MEISRFNNISYSKKNDRFATVIFFNLKYGQDF